MWEVLGSVLRTTSNNTQKTHRFGSIRAQSTGHIVLGPTGQAAYLWEGVHSPQSKCKQGKRPVSRVSRRTCPDDLKPLTGPHILGFPLALTRAKLGTELWMQGLLWTVQTPAAAQDGLRETHPCWASGNHLALIGPACAAGTKEMPSENFLSTRGTTSGTVMTSSLPSRSRTLIPTLM